MQILHILKRISSRIRAVNERENRPITQALLSCVIVYGLPYHPVNRKHNLALEILLMEAKSENARVFEISAHVKDPQVAKITPEPSTTARLNACVASAR